MELNSQTARFLLFAILSQTYIFLLFIIPYLTQYQILFEFLIGVWSEIQALDRIGVFQKSSIKFLKRLASTLNTAAQQSRNYNVHKIARGEIQGFTYLLKTYISSVNDAELYEEGILDSLTVLTWYIHRFWKTLVRHIVPATKLLAETYPQLIPKLHETLHYLYDSNWLPQNYINITEVPSEIIQKLSINHNNIEIKKP